MAPRGKSEVGNCAMPSASTDAGLPSCALPAWSVTVPVGAIPMLFVRRDTGNGGSVDPKMIVGGGSGSAKIVARVIVTLVDVDVDFLKLESPG